MFEVIVNVLLPVPFDAMNALEVTATPCVVVISGTTAAPVGAIVEPVGPAAKLVKVILFGPRSTKDEEELVACNANTVLASTFITVGGVKLAELVLVPL